MLIINNFKRLTDRGRFRQQALGTGFLNADSFQRIDFETSGRVRTNVIANPVEIRFVPDYMFVVVSLPQ